MSSGWGVRTLSADHPLTIPTAIVPIVVHTRLDSRQDANALLSTIAYSQAA